MKIGQIAKKCGITADTIRYYEKEGLLNRTLRQDNGYRLYSETDVVRLQFILMAKKLGFSLMEIRKLLPDIESGTLSRQDLEQRLHVKLRQLDDKIKELQQLRVEVAAIFQQLNCSPDAPVIIGKLVG